MTVAELIAALQKIEDQTLPVFWEDSEEGRVSPGSATIELRNLRKYKGHVDGVPQYEQKTINAIQLGYGPSLEEIAFNVQANRP